MRACFLGILLDLRCFISVFISLVFTYAKVQTALLATSRQLRAEFQPYIEAWLWMNPPMIEMGSVDIGKHYHSDEVTYASRPEHGIPNINDELLEPVSQSRL